MLKYNFRKADYNGLYNALSMKDWSTITQIDDVMMPAILSMKSHIV